MCINIYVDQVMQDERYPLLVDVFEWLCIEFYVVSC